MAPLKLFTQVYQWLFMADAYKLQIVKTCWLARSAQAIGVELDLVEKGLGMRSRRYAMLLDDDVVRHFLEIT